MKFEEDLHGVPVLLPLVSYYVPLNSCELSNDSCRKSFFIGSNIFNFIFIRTMQQKMVRWSKHLQIHIHQDSTRKKLFVQCWMTFWLTKRCASLHRCKSMAVLWKGPISVHASAVQALSHIPAIFGDRVETSSVFFALFIAVTGARQPSKLELDFAEHQVQLVDHKPWVTPLPLLTKADRKQYSTLCDACIKLSQTFFSSNNKDRHLYCREDILPRLSRNWPERHKANGLWHQSDTWMMRRRHIVTYFLIILENSC